MIEMLGVLAIIGVLSAGGVWGYNVAMENYKVNKFVDDISISIANAQNLFIGRTAPHTYSVPYLQKAKIIPDSYKQTNCPSWLLSGSALCTETPVGKVYLIYEYSDNSPNWATMGIVSPAACLKIFLSALGNRKCVKVLSGADWTSVAPIAVFIASGADTFLITKRITTKEAENYCKGSVNLYLFYKGRLVK